MPIRGENIGSAYVRIFGDGSSMPSDVRDALNESEPSVREGAREHGRVYGEEFDKSVRKSYKGHWDQTQREMFDDMNNSLTKSLAHLELADRFFKSKGWNDFKTRLGDEGGVAGDLLAKRLEEQFRDSGNLDKLADTMRDLGPLLRKAQRDLLNDLHADALRLNREFDIRVKQVHSDMLDEAHQMNLDFDREMRETGQTLNRSVDDLVRFSNGFRRSFGHGGDVDHGHSRLHMFNTELDNLSDGIGRIFGKGSRNNFLNFFGTVIGGVTRIPGLLFKALEQTLGWVDSFKQMVGEKGLLGAIGTVAGTTAIGIVGLAVAIGVLIAVLGPVIALMSGLLGILVALSSTVIMAAVAGIAALAGALLPLAAGIGVAIAGFVGLPKAAKDSARGVLDAVKDLGQRATDGLLFDRTRLAEDHDHTVRSFSDMMDVIEQMVRSLGPITEQVGRAVADSIDIFLDTMTKGRGAWDKFVNAISRDRDKNGLGWLAEEVRVLGRIFSNVFGGMLGLFRGIMPITNDFLRYLERITGQFEEWANSRQGQEEIRQFLEDAADSAESLMDFLGEAGGLLGDLITSGNDAGDHMFDGMTRAIKDFRDYISEPITVPPPIMGGRFDPEQILPKSTDVQTRLESWFQFASDLADKLGDAAVEAGKLMDNLDDEDARQNLLDILDLLDKIIAGIDKITAAGDFISRFFDPIMLAVGAGFDNLQATWEWLKGLDWKGLIPDIPTFGGGHALLTNFTGLGPKIAKAIGKVDVGDIITGVGHAISFLVAPFTAVPGKVLGKIGKVDVGDIITGVPAALLSLINPFDGSGSKVLDKIDPVNVSGIITGVASALASLLNPFDGTIAKILGKISPVNVSGIITGAFDAANAVVAPFIGIRQRILDLIGGVINIGVNIDWPSPPGWLDKVTASGGVFSGAQARIIGEAGPEAVVPLNRPLDLVDPSVRWLSAIAQGKSVPAPGADSSRTIDARGWTIVTPTTDPYAVAQEVLNRVAAAQF